MKTGTQQVGSKYVPKRVIPSKSVAVTLVAENDPNSLGNSFKTLQLTTGQGGPVVLKLICRTSPGVNTSATACKTDDYS